MERFAWALYRRTHRTREGPGLFAKVLAEAARLD
jgi:hypothetical protein